MKKNFSKLYASCIMVSIFLLSGCASSVKQPEPLPAPAVASAPSTQFKQFTAAQYFLSHWLNLPGWEQENFVDVWHSWQKSCQFFNKSSQLPWQQVCTQAQTVSSLEPQNIKDFFEKNFQVWEIRQAKESHQYPRGSQLGMITGYFEPVIKGSLKREGVYQTPLYKLPPSWSQAPSRIRPPRAKLMSSGELDGLEIAWLEDPVAAAFMQIQGSGKILLDNQNIVRLGYAGTNNQAFTSFAQWLIQQKQMTYAQSNMQNISQWAKNNPTRVQEMLNANPRFVFFRVLENSANPLDGPIGSIGVPLTTGRSIAVDWQSIPRGAPVYIATTDPQTQSPLQRLVFAQDTGAAIIGGVRADYFWGTGDPAGDKAGKMKHAGKLWAILPKNLYP